MHTKVKRRLGLIVILLGIYFCWLTFELAGWSVIVTLKAISVVSFVFALLICVCLQKLFLHFKCQAEFLFIILALISALILGVSDSDFILPFNVDVNRWLQSAKVEVFGWFMSSVVILAFMFSLHGPVNISSRES